MSQSGRSTFVVGLPVIGWGEDESLTDDFRVSLSPNPLQQLEAYEVIPHAIYIEALILPVSGD